MKFLSPYICFRRLKALCYKEALQILRDPSSNLIAFVLPIVLLFIFSYGINLDADHIRVGLLLEDTSPVARQFADSLFGSPYLDIQTASSRQELTQALTEGRIRGFIVISQDFSKRLDRPDDTTPVQLITDGSEPNTANFVEAYVRGAWAEWLQQRALTRGKPIPPGIDLEPRFWFNPSAESRNFLIPGSITLIMTVIGAMLTSLVVAREWERGTMEALLSSPITRTEFLLSKLIPYFALGIVSLLFCVGVAVFVLRVPFQGSFFMLLTVSSFFLISALGLGLCISTLMRNQFNAAQAALNIAFLPAVMLSGFVYEISSMPAPIRAITYLFPARYFVRSIRTLFQAGDIWAILWVDTLFLAIASIVLIGLSAYATKRNLQ